MKTEHLRAVIIKVTEGDKVITSQAFGESVAGVPSTTAMRFPNGAVAFAYLGTLLMEFVDEHKVKLDDTIDQLDADATRGQQGHVENAGEPNLGLSRLRDRSGVDRRLERKS